jgi:hypothetical protein
MEKYKLLKTISGDPVRTYISVYSQHDFKNPINHEALFGITFKICHNEE